MSPRSALPALLLAAACLLLPAAPAEAGFSQRTWLRRDAAATRAAEGRDGRVGFAAFDQHGRLVAAHRPHEYFRSASVVKAMFAVCYLNDPDVRDRALTRRERGLLRAMLTRSADEPANFFYGRVRHACLYRLARDVGMPRFSTQPVWGFSRVSPYGVARLFWGIDTRIPARHRTFAMAQLRGVVRAQRWGLAQTVPRGMTIAFKGGFAGIRGGGWMINQGALLAAPNGHRISTAVLTTGSNTDAYGHETIRLVGSRLLRGYRPTPAMPRPGG